MYTKNPDHMMYASRDMERDRFLRYGVWLLHMYTINEDHTMYGSLDIKARQAEFIVILCNFLPFDPLNNPKNQNIEKMKKSLETSFYTCASQMTIIWCTAPEMWSILDYFLPFYHPNNLENQHLEKLNKIPGDIILRSCTTNENDMMYGSLDMERNRQNLFSLWTILCPFNPLTNQKIKILKKWKKYKKTKRKRLEISSF